MTELTIKTAANGFIVTYENEYGEDTQVLFSWHDNDDKECFVNLLNYIKEYFGYYGSKHDEKRIFVKLEDNQLCES